MDTIKKAIQNTIVYSDLFDYPLTVDELWYFYKGDSFVPKEAIEKTVAITPGVSNSNTYFFLKGRSHLMQHRTNREYHSKRKLNRSKRICNVLRCIPTIKFIGISGSVASNNAHEYDDIDLFIITKRKMIWTTRLAILLILQLLGMSRRKNDVLAKNKICLNMLIDESRMTFPKHRQDIYTAHEIAQLKPIFERNNAYKHFLQANIWIQKYMPHVLPYHNVGKAVKRNTLMSQSIVSKSIEVIARSLQMRSINKTRTNETISDSFLAFHPHDYRLDTIAAYSQKRLTL